MLITDLGLNGVKLVHLKVHGDGRGYFMETWRDTDWRPILGDRRFIQDNQSMSVQSGTLRGLHYQRAPFAQGKLVQPVRGRIYDVAVDLRRSSGTFGRHVGVELSAGDGKQVFVPEGFAHGFVTLEANTIVTYKVTARYEPSAECGIAWNDPDLAIGWPMAAGSVVVSDRDKRWPRLKDVSDLF